MSSLSTSISDYRVSIQARGDTAGCFPDGTRIAELDEQLKQAQTDRAVLSGRVTDETERDRHEYPGEDEDAEEVIARCGPDLRAGDVLVDLVESPQR